MQGNEQESILDPTVMGKCQISMNETGRVKLANKAVRIFEDDAVMGVKTYVMFTLAFNSAFPTPPHCA